MEDEMEQWLTEMWEERKVDAIELQGLLNGVGSTLNIERTTEDKNREYKLWRVRMISHCKFFQLPKEEHMRRGHKQFKQIRKRRARQRAIRDN
ncbi:hypothetical protein G0Q06_11825 [Puniceicoccales bacterium CK1056]|uniref:Uncharacterized protein n=1 Tax=Oceanipulchritudo coccoides TaxID=2706888 RepID=A0A6B2M316_9BACT|nr:hypothetical protein [Oceanipulchritudo coccoides]NDV63143.1 hypothetical protein [Oceanipulchritudo coccoides]